MALHKDLLALIGAVALSVGCKDSAIRALVPVRTEKTVAVCDYVVQPKDTADGIIRKELGGEFYPIAALTDKDRLHEFYLDGGRIVSHRGPGGHIQYQFTPSNVFEALNGERFTRGAPRDFRTHGLYAGEHLRAPDLNGNGKIGGQPCAVLGFAEFIGMHDGTGHLLSKQIRWDGKTYAVAPSGRLR